MKAVEDKIRAEGKIGEGDVLMVGSFLNQQMDIALLSEAGKEFYRLFGGEGVTKILTIEASGIGIACLAAQYFGVPVVFAKKSRTSNVAGDVYRAPVISYTHHTTADAIVAKEYLHKEDRVLLIDDFLAKGNALVALSEIVKQAGATLVGAGIVIEKQYQGGGDALRAEGMRVESLAKITAMDPEHGCTFAEE